MTSLMFAEFTHRCRLPSLHANYINIHDASLLGRFFYDLYVYNQATFVNTPANHITISYCTTIAALQATTGLFLHNGANYVTKGTTGIIENKIVTGGLSKENWVPSTQVTTWTALGPDLHAASPGLPLRFVLVRYANGADIIPAFLTDSGNIIGRFSDGNDFKIDVPVLFHENNIMGDTT